MLGYSRQPLRFSQDFIGPTAQTAILEEVKADLGPVDEADDQGDDETKSWNGESKMWTADSKGMRFCIAILAWLPPQAVSRELFDWFDGEYECWLPQRWLIKSFHEAFWSTYGHNLQDPRSPERTAAVAADVVRNTKQPMPVPANNA